MKVVWITMLLAGVAWASWLWRYDVQVIPVNVSDFNENRDDQTVLGDDGVLYRFDATDGLLTPCKYKTGELFKPLVPKSPAIVWQWDRWTATGSVRQFAQVDAAGRVTLSPVPDK